MWPTVSAGLAPLVLDRRLVSRNLSPFPPRGTCYLLFVDACGHWVSVDQDGHVALRDPGFISSWIGIPDLQPHPLASQASSAPSEFLEGWASRASGCPC